MICLFLILGFFLIIIFLWELFVIDFGWTKDASYLPDTNLLEEMLHSIQLGEF